MIVSIWRILWCLSASKKSTSYLLFFWRYCKDMQASYLGYFGHAWISTPKMIVQTCRKLRCLSACQKYTFIIHFFLEILKNPTTFWLITRDLEFCQIWNWWWNINNIISFLFRLFPGKINTKFFKKSKKPYLGTILGSFFWIWAKINFPGKRSLSAFKYSNYLPSCKKTSKKLMSHSWEKCRTDRQTDRNRQTTKIL